MSMNEQQKKAMQRFLAQGGVPIDAEAEIPTPEPQPAMMVDALVMEREELRQRLTTMHLENRAWLGMCQEVLRVFGDDFVTVDQEELITKLREIVELKMQGKI